MTILAWIAGLWVLWSPGIVLAAFRRRHRDAGVEIAIELATGLAFWPLLFLWSSTIGLRWSAFGARAAVAAVSVAALVRLIRKPPRVRGDLVWFSLVVVVLATVVTRVVQVRDLVLPAWVDSVHHTMIARLLIEQGTLPDTYAPFIPEGRFYYHWGYHAVVAIVCWTIGTTSPAGIARAILDFGQLLNCLAPLAVYAGTRVLFRSRRAGVIAAALAALVSYFPAYYVSWGRYTHLAGTVMLPPFAVLLWRVRSQRGAGGISTLAMVAAGLFLVHVRMALFAMTLALTLALVLAKRREWSAVRGWIVAAAIAALVTSPWLIELSGIAQVRKILRPSAAEWEMPNQIQQEVLWAPHNRELLALASGGLTALAGIGSPATRIGGALWWLLLIVVLQREYRRRGVKNPPWMALGILAGWCALTMAAINGVPVRIAPNNAAVITLFIPLSAAAGGLVAWALGAIAPRRAAKALTLVVVAGLAIFGLVRLHDLVSPVTVLAHDEDLRAIDWIRRETPPQAKFAVRVQPWLGRAFIGADGGYWIPLLADRAAILPPGLYTWVLPEADEERSTALLNRWATATDLDASLHRELRAAGVTHVYFGVNSGTIGAEMIGNPYLDLVYRDGAVCIFALMPERDLRQTDG